MAARYLDRILPVTQRSATLNRLTIFQLGSATFVNRLTSCLRTLSITILHVARCLARIYLIGDSSTFGDTLNLCNDTLKIKMILQANFQLNSPPSLLHSIVLCNNGKGVGLSFVDTFPIMVKWLKVAESQGRAEILITLSSMVTGLGSGAANFHKDVYKAAKAHLADRVMAVRAAALQCVTALVPVYPPLYSTELEASDTCGKLKAKYGFATTKHDLP
ncbi:HEAT repeat protein [Ostertagia ostertagi]